MKLFQFFRQRLRRPKSRQDLIMIRLDGKAVIARKYVLYLPSIIHSTLFSLNSPLQSLTLYFSFSSNRSIDIHHVSRRRDSPIGISHALPTSSSVRCCSPDHSRFPAGNSHEELFEEFAVCVHCVNSYIQNEGYYANRHE